MGEKKTNDSLDTPDLIEFDSKKYGEKYQDHLIEQYRIYVEMADRIGARRTQANSFFLGINTALIAAGAALYKKGYTAPPKLVLIVLVAVLALCYTWWRLIKSYRQLNTAKYRIILLLEKHLPSAPYGTEWTMLGEGRNPKLYRPLTTLEGLVPLLFAVLFILLGICIAFFPLQG